MTTNRADPTRAGSGLRLRTVVEIVVVALVTAFVLWRLRPALIFRDSLPVGGDVSQHVWGPDYLRRAVFPGLTGWSWDWFAGFPAFRFYSVLPALAVVALDMVLPYGVAMKLVMAAGPLLLPLAAWGFARLWKLPFPTAPLFAVVMVPFLFDTTYPVAGGTIGSAVSGEYHEAVGLLFAVVALGLLAPVLLEGRARVWFALAFAIAALCHPLVLVFEVVGVVAIVGLHLGRDWRASLRRVWPPVAVGLALAGIWWVPFVLRHGSMTAQGLPRTTGITKVLPFVWVEPLVLALAIAGVVLGLRAGRRIAGGLGIMAVVFGILFLVVPHSLLDNKRMLTFWSWSRLALVAIGIAELALVAQAALARRGSDTNARRVLLAAPVAALLVAIGAVMVVWQVAPFDTDRPYFADLWIRTAFDGYDKVPAYPEYAKLMKTLGQVGREHGCGRFMWSVNYRPGLDNGSVSNALAPYWTHGCIQSLTGLYLESSATTPFESLTESLVAVKPQRFAANVPYRNYDLAEGVRHLQYAGVRYFATSYDQIKRDADANADLELVATSGPWNVYQVRHSDLVAALAYSPVVLDASDPSWPVASAAYTESAPRWNELVLAEHGPAAWPRVGFSQSAPDKALPAVTVSRARLDGQGLSFHVDRTGVPVLVKASYFPTWKVDGGEGPYRVAGNMMVVIPTEHTVRLFHKRGLPEWLAFVSFLAGAGGLVWLGLHDRRGHRSSVAVAAASERSRSATRPESERRPPKPATASASATSPREPTIEVAERSAREAVPRSIDSASSPSGKESVPSGKAATSAKKPPSKKRRR